MSHICATELNTNTKLNKINNKINKIFDKQRKSCLNVSICQPILLCSCIGIVIFGLWLQYIQTQQNSYW